MALTSNPVSPLIITLIICALTLTARAQTDTVEHRLRDVEVTALRNRSSLRTEADGTLHLDLRLTDEMPKIMGNADPLHFTQMLPSVSTNAEFDAGFHLQGCATSQSLLAIDHAPIYNVAHMLGFFSTFIPTHFTEFSLRTTADATTPNLLGGALRMVSDRQPADTLSGTVALGPMSSQGTLRLSMGKRQSLTLSARQSYINLLYGNLVKFDDMAFRYRFGDYNLSFAGRYGRHRLTANAYYGKDRARMADGALDLDLRLAWQNYAVSLDLETDTRRGLLEQSLYATGYHNDFRLLFTALQGDMPSHIHTTAYRLSHTHRLDSLSRHRLAYGLHLQQHAVLPQSPETQGDYAINVAPALRQHATEATAFLLYTWRPSVRWTVQPGLKAIAYRLWNDSPATYRHADPSVTLRYETPRLGRLALTLASAHQYLHQSGFSGIGLPTEFRFSATPAMPPQQALGATLAFSRHLFRSRYKLSVELYAKRMRHQVEYEGDVLQFVTSGYSLEGAILHGHGYNYGLNLQLIKQTGRLTGWLSYAYNRSRRRFPCLSASDYFPSNYERPHELNGVATCRLGRRWSVGATLVFASGTPFTPVRSIYYLHNRLISEYGAHNSARLRPCFRLDLSANYRFRPRRARSGLNLSLYNATAYKNEIYYRVKVYNSHFSYRRAHFLSSVLPSVNYFLEF